ncbi:MAG: fibrobacter succinogenes major paralogous domain-containing protein, partial [Bacteroidales bacterium]|nr:fibrobacter succinogenes major paralogous domain-containing protein [Bacteroidales bacterium]
NIIYVTPLEGSAKAYLVSDPLPIDFSISKDVVTKVVPEVLSTEDASPEDFGYVSTSFDIVETFDFLIGVFIYNEAIENFEMTDASISISGDGSVIYTGIVEALTDTITLRDGYAEYEITVEKTGYEIWVDTFANAELKLYYSSEDEGPLEVVLDCGCPSTLTDIDGNVYPIVKIGTQCWMAENLKVTKFNDGTPIPLIEDSMVYLTTPAYCWFDNDESSFKNVYGALYNWYTISTGKLCPDNCHIPTKEEWNTLIEYLGGEEIAGGKMKETGFNYWIAPNTGATNESGFNARGSGICNAFYTVQLKQSAYFWTSDVWFDEYWGVERVWYVDLKFGNDDAMLYNTGAKSLGISIRCIMD